jgi:hypothetical protein
MEGIAELIDEIDLLHVTIADQSMEYIHAEYVDCTILLPFILSSSKPYSG